MDGMDARPNAQNLQESGNSLAEEGRFAEAIKAFEEALVVAASSELYESVAQCQLMLETQVAASHAVVAAKEATLLAPGWDEGHFTLGRAYLRVGEAEAAVTCFQRALHLTPDHAGAEEELHTALRVLERYRRRLQETDVDSAWEHRWRRKVSRARRRRRPNWSDAEWSSRKFAALDLKALFDVCEDNISKVEVATVSADEFAARFQASSTPALLRGAMDNWEALKEWSVTSFANSFGHKKIVCDHRCGLSMRMADFELYANSQTDDTPLYLFDHAFGESPTTHHLLQHYHVPNIFSEDLFDGMDERLRPPYRWLLVGPCRSGSFLHKDPLGTSAWNALTSGLKLWVLFPPATPASWLHPEQPERGNEESASCWFLTWWHQLKSRAMEWSKKFQPIEFIQRPGEVVFVPARWWHTVLNLEDTIAVTQNFCSRWNVKDVWCCTAATHPILARHVQRCVKEEWPDRFREILEHPPTLVDGDDPSLSYGMQPGTSTTRDTQFPLTKSCADDAQKDDSSSSDEEYALWLKNRARLKRLRSDSIDKSSVCAPMCEEFQTHEPLKNHERSERR